MDFQTAQEQVKTITKRPSNEEFLELYALFKQATSGDVTGKRPGMLNMKGRYKYDAWASKKGISTADAESSYVALVETLISKYA